MGCVHTEKEEGSMAALKGLKPEKVFEYFEKLCSVPHGSGNTTTYQHLSSRSVSVGTYVAQGQVVGITGTTGVSSGPHLHFEITENGQIINPLKYLTDYIKGW